MPSAPDTPLIDAALAARGHAYAPYSHFAVGAALRCEDGTLFSGCNVENAAYPEGVCAEAGAISAMIRAGKRRITALVVAGEGPPACTPCGGCRQKIREFAAPATPVTIVDPVGAVLLTTTLAALLPDSFGPDHLA
ncbi:MAG: cytidine deaminase [Azospirillaceae bacterium]|nr:cytidine deaminase [Azospirillaceae bacterium]